MNSRPTSPPPIQTASHRLVVQVGETDPVGLVGVRGEAAPYSIAIDVDQAINKTLGHAAPISSSPPIVIDNWRGSTSFIRSTSPASSPTPSPSQRLELDPPPGALICVVAVWLQALDCSRTCNAYGTLHCKCIYRACNAYGTLHCKCTYRTCNAYGTLH